MSRGGAFSIETLAIESELREVQQRSSELQKKGKCLNDQVDKLLQNHNWKTYQINIRKAPTENQNKVQILPKKNDAVSRSVSKDFYSELKTNHINKNKIEPKNFSFGDISMIIQKDSPKITQSEDSSESDQKYLDLIDLLTVKMFQSDIESETSRDDNQKCKKANSLPRTFGKCENALQKSSSQTIFQTQPHKPSQIPIQPSQLTAYERLFGMSRPNSRSSSPVGRERKKVQVFIPKVNSRSRHTSGSTDRPGVLDALGMLESKRLSSRSEENVSTVGRRMIVKEAYDRAKHGSSNSEARSSKIGMDFIDSLFSAPDKIVIPERYQVAEEVK